MINQSFLESLEYSISKAMANSSNKEERTYWCDGIIVDDLNKEQELTSSILRSKSLKAIAIIPKEQYAESDYRFDLNIFFGKEAMSRLRNGLDLENSIPEINNSNWIALDLSSKSISIQLK
jgi:hypothetical protein